MGSGLSHQLSQQGLSHLASASTPRLSSGWPSQSSAGPSHSSQVGLHLSCAAVHLRHTAILQAASSGSVQPCMGLKSAARHARRQLLTDLSLPAGAVQLAAAAVARDALFGIPASQRQPALQQLGLCRQAPRGCWHTQAALHALGECGHVSIRADCTLPPHCLVHSLGSTQGSSCHTSASDSCTLCPSGNQRNSLAPRSPYALATHPASIPEMSTSSAQLLGQRLMQQPSQAQSRPPHSSYMEAGPSDWDPTYSCAPFLTPAA